MHSEVGPWEREARTFLVVVVTITVPIAILGLAAGVRVHGISGLWPLWFTLAGLLLFYAIAAGWISPVPWTVSWLLTREDRKSLRPQTADAIVARAEATGATHDVARARLFMMRGLVTAIVGGSVAVVSWANASTSSFDTVTPTEFVRVAETMGVLVVFVAAVTTYVAIRFR